MHQIWQRTVVVRHAQPSGDGFGLAYIEAMRWEFPLLRLFMMTGRSFKRP